MPAPITDVNLILNPSGCYSGQTIEKRDQLAIQIYLLAAQLAAVGGTNYVGNLDTLLIPASVCYSTLQPDELDKVDTQIMYNEAVAAGATIGDISAQLAQACRLRNQSKEALRGAYLYLRASLGYAKTYPQ